MRRIYTATARVKRIAQDNRYGYSQPRRSWDTEDDCSTGAIDALREAGYELKGATYTGDVLQPMLDEGFIDVASQVNLRTGAGLQEGDVLLRPRTQKKNGHMALMISDTQLVQFQQDYDGKPGDSSGREIRIQNYYDSPFKYVLRDPNDVEPEAPKAPKTVEGTITKCQNFCYRRSGPGTEYARVGRANRGQVCAFNGKHRNKKGETWYHDTIGNWIRSDFVALDPTTLPEM